MVSESVSCPVSMMIGALKPPLRKERTTSRPSVSGKPTSINTRSGELAFAAVAPLAPVSTAEASNSSCNDSCSTNVSRRSVLSSPMRILRALAMVTILFAAAVDAARHQPNVGKVWSRLVLFLIEVRNHSRFTRRRELYFRNHKHFYECPVMEPGLATAVHEQG